MSRVKVMTDAGRLEVVRYFFEVVRYFFEVVRSFFEVVRSFFAGACLYCQSIIPEVFLCRSMPELSKYHTLQISCPLSSP